MRGTPKCFSRRCIHFTGAIQPDGTELTERVVCSAYPNGIPNSITRGDDDHREIRQDQDTDIVFERQQP